MSLELTQIAGENLNITEVNYSPELRAFSANLSTGEILDFHYPLDIDQKYKIGRENFTLYLFHKDLFAANDIYEISFKKQRLGWFFPIQALLTDQHDQANNEHFLPYAENSYQRLLLNLDNLPYFLQNIENVTLDKIYGENTYVLILFNTYLTSYYNSLQLTFDIQDYLVYLYLYGFTYIENEAALKSFYSNSFSDNRKDLTGTSVQIKPISKDLITDKVYINSIFQGLLKLEKHPLVKFHLLYSLIELFITKIFEFDFSANLTLFQNSHDFYDAKEKLTKLTNEKSRLNKLFESQCSGIDYSIFESLKVSCNNFLNYIDKSKTYNKSASESIYKVRSSIFHNLRNMPPDYDVYLNNVLHNLEIVVLEIVLKMDMK